jgi:hypothetical protein
VYQREGNGGVARSLRRKHEAIRRGEGKRKGGWAGHREVVNVGGE